jgi:A/G-specific adenine glycosylase
MAQRTTIKTAPSQIKPAALRKFHGALAAWYTAHGRHDLPWRTTDDPYHIWLSEVMLQQTQVATVRARFYFPFLEKFPTVKDLADAPREKVMKAWEGLGYYRRAGNLHEAAKLISSSRARPGISRNDLSPRLGIPGRARDDAHLEALLTLPGVGKNTAHAILAFAYHQPVAILEANVKRIIARVFALTHPSDAQLWEGAETLLNQAEPFNYNQAMMDVGSMVCTPKNPDCPNCPANSICTGKTAPESYPAPKAKKQVPTREVTIHVREDARGKLFLEKRDEALLGGLYGFPQVTSKKGKIKKHSQSSGDWRLVTGDYLGLVTHIYSHFKLIGHVVMERMVSKPNSPDWYSREEIAALPLSKLDHKVLALVENCHSSEKKSVKPRRAQQAR